MGCTATSADVTAREARAARQATSSDKTKAGSQAGRQQPGQDSDVAGTVVSSWRPSKARPDAALTARRLGPPSCARYPEPRARAGEMRPEPAR